MNRIRTRIWLSAAFIAIGAAFSSGRLASAQTISYSTGFETGQGFPLNSNLPTTPSALSGWSRLDGFSASIAQPIVDINATNNGGSQGLRVQNASPFNQADLQSYTYALSPVINSPGATDLIANGTPIVKVKFDMRVDDTANITQSTDIWFAEIFDDNTGQRLAGIGRVVIAPGDARIYATGADGEVVNSPIGLAAASGVWGSYEMDLNYVTRTFQVFLNNVAVGGVQSMYDLGSSVLNAPYNGLDFDFSESGRGLDVAYFDNVSILAAVPEPTSLALAGLGAAAALLKRRR
jgi:hypothetical protein